jgi:hypothetical protein
MRAVFAYNNLDDTSDLNAHFKTLVGRGVVSGGEILPVSGTSNITVNPFYASSVDGMIVWETTFTTLSCMPGIVNVVVLRAVYNAPAAPTLSFEVMPVNNYNSDPQKANLIVFGRVDMTAATTTALSQVSYATRDVVNKLAHDPFLGVYADYPTFSSAWPAAVPAKQKPNDFALVIAGTNGKPEFYNWSGSAWNSFGNYETLLSDYVDHTSGVVGAGSIVHVTANEKAAIAGTSGVPGAGNRFVTEGDTTRVLSSDQKAALDNAIAGGNLSSSNPLIGDGLPVTIGKLISFTATAAQDFINVYRADQGSGTPFFGAPVFVGKLGLDTAHSNRSSSRQYFKVEDDKFNGYMDEDGPLYVIDVQDAAGSGSFNAAASSDVTSIGYWAPTAGTSALRVKFNRPVAVGKTIYLRYNGLGRVSQLAPTGPYAPPSTGFRAGVEAYQEVHTQVVTAQTIAEQVVTSRSLFANGSSVMPSIAFSANTDTGFYYVGDIVSGNLYSGIGVAVDGETVLTIARRQSSGSSSLAPDEVPLVIEQNYATGKVTYRIYTYNAAASNRAVGVEFGAASYTNEYDAYMRVGRTDSTSESGVILYRQLLMQDGVRIVAANGSEVAPSIVFNGDRDTGFYYNASVTNTNASIYNVIGISVNGHTAFAFATNVANRSLAGDMRGSLVFEQAIALDGSIEFRQLINGGAETPPEAAHVFGATSYAYDSDAWLRVDNAWTEALGRVWAKGGLYIGGSARDSEFLRLSATNTSWSLVHNGNGVFAYASGILDVSGSIKATGSVTATQGTEAAPSYTFTGAPNTGFYYAGAINTAGIKTRSAVGVSIEGAATVIFGRNEANPGTLAATEVPLLFEQVIDGGNVESRICQMDRVTGGAGIGVGTNISLGFGDYNTDYSPWIKLDNNTSSQKGVELYQNAWLSKNLRVVGDTLLSGAATFNDRMRSTADSTVTAPAFGLSTTAATGMYGSATFVGLALNGNPVFAANATTTALYRNGNLFATVDVDSFNLSVGLETTGGINATGNIVTQGSVTAGTTLGVIGASVFAGSATFGSTVIFNGHVTFNSTATLPPINLLDLNDVTYLTGTTLEQYFTELGLNAAVPPATDPASGANIKAVLDGMGDTQVKRLEFLNETKKKLNHFTDIYGVKHEMIVARSVSGTIFSRHFGTTADRYYEGEFTCPTNNVPVRTANLFSTTDSPADFSTEVVQGVVPYCFQNGVPAPGTVIDFWWNWDVGDLSPDGLRIFLKMFTPLDISGYDLDPHRYGYIDINVIGNVCRTGQPSPQPITIYAPYTTLGGAPGYAVAYQKIKITGSTAALQRTIRLVPRRVANDSNDRIAWQPFVTTTAISALDTSVPGWLDTEF